MEVTERFWAKVDVRGPDDCWEWTAGGRNGYGVFHPDKQHTVAAHRYSLQMKLGREMLPGMFACHTCDNPACVNPRHLYEGTSQDNVDDAVSRGRHKRGVMDPNAKLTDAQVVSIRTLIARGAKNREVARIYHVQESLVSGIARGYRWAHVGGPRTNKYKTQEVNA